MTCWRASTFRLILVLLTAGVVVPAGGKEPQPAKAENKNTLIKAHLANLKLTCSSTFNGWPVERIVDGDTKTSWFSDGNDSVAKGKKPWVQIEFPVDVLVTRVNIMGNREAPFDKTFSVLEGRIEFFDTDGKKLWSEEGKAIGLEYDFEFTPKKPVAKVRSIRFTSLKDEGNLNGFGDVAIGEVLVE
jgi:hypothetical protein